MKICYTCKIEKSKDSFYKDNRNKDGLRGSCKICINYIDTARRKSDPEKMKKYYLDNLDKKKTYNKIWRKQNAKKEFSTRKEWQLKNLEKCANNNATRRAKKLRATPVWANSEFEKFAIQEIYALAKLRTKLTGIMHHVDHIVPLNSKIVQGFHCLANLQILEAKQNISKNNRSWPDMPILEKD